MCSSDLSVICAADGIAASHVFFDTISAFTTAGLSMGLAPTLSALSLFVLDIVMFIGRLGPLSVGLMFTKQDRSAIKFPPANIMIG